MNEPMTIQTQHPKQTNTHHPHPHNTTTTNTKKQTHPQILNIYHSPYITPQQKTTKHTKNTQKKEKV